MLMACFISLPIRKMHCTDVLTQHKRPVLLHTASFLNAGSLCIPETNVCSSDSRFVCPLPAVCLSLPVLYQLSVPFSPCLFHTRCLSVIHPLPVPLFVPLCLDSMLSFSSRLIPFRLTSDLSFTLSFSHTLTLSDTHKLPHTLAHSHTRGHSCRRWVDRCWNIGAI